MAYLYPKHTVGKEKKRKKRRKNQKNYFQIKANSYKKKTLKTLEKFIKKLFKNFLIIVFSVNYRNWREEANFVTRNSTTKEID